MLISIRSFLRWALRSGILDFTWLDLSAGLHTQLLFEFWKWLVVFAFSGFE